MKQFVAIVKHTGNTLDKYQDFDTQPEADAHIAAHGGFVVANPGGNSAYWVVDGTAKTVVYDQAANDSDAVMDTWYRGIAATDKEMPRFFEDYLDSVGPPAAGRVRDNYDAKVALRGQKP